MMKKRYWMGSFFLMALITQPAWSQEVQEEEVEAVWTLDDAASLSEIPLPYEGFGKISVLENGQILLTIGGEATVRHKGEVEILDLTPSATFFLIPDKPTVLSINSDQEWTIRNHSKKKEDRNAKPVTSNNVTVNPQSLLDLAGDLTVKYDDPSHLYTVEITGLDQSEVLTFSFSLNELKEHRTAMAKTDCSANCERGSCNISCNGSRRANCSCSTTGYPQCSCGTAMGISMSM